MRSFLAGAAMLTALASTASAQTVTPIAPDPGPASLFQQNVLDFTNCSTPADVSIVGGACKTESESGSWAQPAGSFSGGGFYTTTPPYPNSTITIDFSTWLSNRNFVGITSLSLFWGSIDRYNTLQFLSASNAVLFEIEGQDLPPANGNQTALNTNQRINVDFGGSGLTDFRKLRFISDEAAFEFDDVAIQGRLGSQVVPEPASLALLAAGLGALGVVGARRKRNA